MDALHRRASQWYEDQGLELEAFHHATAGQDIERAERLIEGQGVPLHFRGAAAPVLAWLKALPAATLEARPALLVIFASALAMTGQLSGVEPRLQGAEAALRAEPAQGSDKPDDKTRNLVGHIAAIRALVAAAGNQVETMLVQSQRALEYLSADNLSVRTTTTWILGWAHQLLGDRAAARRAYTEAMSISQASGNTVVYLWAVGGLANIQEADNQLSLAAQTYQLVLQLAGDPPRSEAGVAHLGLARIDCEWNDSTTATEATTHQTVSQRICGVAHFFWRRPLVIVQVAVAAGARRSILPAAAEDAKRQVIHFRRERTAGWVGTLQWHSPLTQTPIPNTR